MSVSTVSRRDGVLANAALDQRSFFKERLSLLTENISRTVVVAEETVRFLLLGLVCRGHILLQDTPGVGKTLIAKILAGSIDGLFSRVQCTPDLLPSDITGTAVYDMSESRFDFKPGPVFSNILLADEINPAGPRTQSALLEAMAEFQVTADGRMHPLPSPFMVIATQNLAESHGVFPLRDSQVDRFLVRMRLGLPTVSQEIDILTWSERGLTPASPVVTTQEVAAMQEVVRAGNVAYPLKEYLVNLARASREHPSLLRGVSPRGTVMLQSAAQGWAAFEGRTYVVPEDVKRVAPLVLPHRLIARAAAETTREETVDEILELAPVPL